MSLSREERQRWLDAIENSASIHGGMTFPEYAYSFPRLCDTKILSMPAVDGFGHAVHFHEAKNRSKPCPVHINIHGGGFIRPHMENDSMYSAFLADAIRGIVLDIDYTTSDKAPWPVAFDQCYALGEYAKARCAEWEADPKRLSMGGYSAGGVLTAGVALKAARTRDFDLCLQVLGYAPMNSKIDPRYKAGIRCPMMSLERGLAFSILYFDGDESCETNPYSSPSYATDEMLAALPPALIITAGRCDFRFEGEEYAARLARQGVEVTVKRFPGAGHGFIPHFQEGWDGAARLIARTIRSAGL
jgi:acetyl esterase